MSVEYARRPFTVTEYDRLADARILGDEDRVELIDGEIIMMSPIGVRHAACVAIVHEVLKALLGDRTHVRSQSPVVLLERSEPNPDIVLLVPRADSYASGHPGPRQVQILIEVSDTTLAFDTQVKLPLYAQAGIRETWIIDLNANQIVVHTRPQAGKYARVKTHGRGERFTSQRFSGVEFKVDQLLPK